MSEKNKEIIRRYVQEIYNNGNLDKLAEFVAPDYVNHTEVQEVEGISGLHAFVTAMRASMPDMHQEIHNQIVEGDLEVHRYTITGTHQEEWLSIPASGNPVTIEGLTLSRLREGKIVEEWTYTNSLALMAQMGAISADMLPGS